MSQYYPQQSPVYPPEYPPEDAYYEDDYEYEVEDDEYGANSGSSLIQYALAFFAGGCLVFMCMGCCLLLAGGAWTLDSALGGGTPIPGADLGLSIDEPAYPEDSVVNEQKIKLTVREVYRNASLPTVPLGEGQELIIVTVELENLNEDEDVSYSEDDFLLLNSRERAYEPIPNALTIEEGALGQDKLRAGTGMEGRLVFLVFANEPGLVLTWEGRDSAPRYIYLE